jgi:uncharacterized membrane protein YoaK (UPF0700 family)
MRKNAVLAAYLAAVAGFVNSGGFVIVGSFTSHVTGSIGRLGNDLAARDTHAALLALLLIASFFVGAVAASVILNGNFRDKSSAYGMALLTESAAIAAFVGVAWRYRTLGPRMLDLQAAMLCFAMGMQNSLVTRLSGAVVRTTHLTGVVTDLGIEVAHWYRRLRSSPAKHALGDTAQGGRGRMLLLLTITFSFIGGAIAGATLMSKTNGWPMLLPALAVGGASAYAFASSRSAS